MSRSASCYTALIKARTKAKNTKVDYPGHVANNWNPLASTLGCNPRFEENIYIDVVEACSARSTTNQVNPVCLRLGVQRNVIIYSGNFSNSEIPIVYDGGDTNNATVFILDGGYSTTE